MEENKKKKSVDLSGLDKFDIKSPAETGETKPSIISKDVVIDKPVVKNVEKQSISVSIDNSYDTLKDFTINNTKFNKSDKMNVPVYMTNYSKLNKAVEVIEKEYGNKVGNTMLLNNIIDHFFKVHKEELEKLHKKQSKDVEF